MRCSHWLDPLPEMVAWLERIADGAVFNRWHVNEEGWVSIVACLRRQDGLGRLLVYGFPFHFVNTADFPGSDSEYDKILIDEVVEPKQVVAEFYAKLRKFSESRVYDPDEWAYVPISARLEELAKRDGFYRPENLYRLTGSEIEKLIKVVDQNDRYDGVALDVDSSFEPVRRLMKAIPTFDESIQADFLKAAFDGSNDGWLFMPPKNYDTWPEKLKKLCLDALLCGTTSAWYGEDLRDLRSTKLDALLNEI